MSDFSGLTSSACALASARDGGDRFTGPGMGRSAEHVELTAPDLERLARTPWPIASLASSGIRALSSVFARSWSKKAAVAGWDLHPLEMLPCHAHILNGQLVVIWLQTKKHDIRAT